MSAEALARLDGNVLLIGIDGTIMDANPSALMAYGYSASEIRELSIFDLRATVEPDDMLARLCQAAEDGRRVEQVHRHSDGTPFPVKIQAIPVVIDRQLGLLCLVHDVSETRQAQSALSRKQSLLERAEALAHIGTWRMAVATGVVEWSDEMYQIFGLDRTASRRDLGQAARDAVHPEDRGRLDELAPEAYRAGLVSDGESRIVRPDGTVRWVRSEARNESNTAGELVALHGFTRDVTRITEAEESLRLYTELLLDGHSRLERMVYSVAEAMGRAVEARDPYTQGHQLRVARLAKLLAAEMGMSADEIDGVEMATVVHDIGKLSVPAEILNKPGALSAQEFDIIRQHPMTGYQILKGIAFPWPVADAVLQHHERFDGSGYPEGLKGEQICCAARIIAVADVVDAIASHRPYRPAQDLDVAVAEIVANSGKYDPGAVGSLLRLHRSGRIAC
jgi:PAS domain S-box-containing protein/putative nucleotidyltransferase with HDIG domain